MRKFRRLVLSAVALLCIAAQAPGVAAVPDIYPDPGKAKTDLAAALQTAAANHRRIIVDFGGNWCTDCHVLDTYFHDAANRPLLEADFILVHVNIGRLDQNLDLAERYQIPLKKGVPALAVLDSDGKLLYSQRTGEFEAMRRMQSSAVTEFLSQWKPAVAR
jgi:thioredoxin 1